jgi:hypothetical protein
MAKQKLFPERPEPPPDDTREPRERFADLATAVFTVPKSEIDKREKRWRSERHTTETAETEPVNDGTRRVRAKQR